MMAGFVQDVASEEILQRFRAFSSLPVHPLVPSLYHGSTNNVEVKASLGFLRVHRITVVVWTTCNVEK